MSEVTSALLAYKAGNLDAAGVASKIKPVSKPKLSGDALLRADASGDVDASIEPGTFDEVLLAFTKGDLDDAQYRDISKAFTARSGASGSRR